MTLLTLVENAVRHGIDPSEEGGRIDVDVRLRDGRCHVRVTDTGVGLQVDGERTGHRPVDAARAPAARVRRRCAVAPHRGASRTACVRSWSFPARQERDMSVAAPDRPDRRRRAAAARRARALLAQAWPELEIVAQARNGREAVDQFEAQQPDVCFLDVHMPGMTGVEAARHIGRRAHLVFVTAYDQYAVQAFAQGVLDYLVKPVEPARLAETVARLQERLRAAQPALEHRGAAAAARREPAARARRRRRCAGCARRSGRPCA